MLRNGHHVVTQRDNSSFRDGTVGQWAPAFLLFGVYNKLVKPLGSDRLSA